METDFDNLYQAYLEGFSLPMRDGNQEPVRRPEEDKRFSLPMRDGNQQPPDYRLLCGPF